MAQPELLIADGSEAQSILAWCLFDCDLTFVDTFGDAVSKLGDTVFSMVLIDLSFAGSYDLLKYVRSLTGYEDVPVVCIQRTERRLGVAMANEISVAVRALGGRAFLDLRAEGEALEQACQYLRQILVLEAGAAIPPAPPSA